MVLKTLLRFLESLGPELDTVIDPSTVNEICPLTRNIIREPAELDQTVSITEQGFTINPKTMYDREALKALLVTNVMGEDSFNRLVKSDTPRCDIARRKIIDWHGMNYTTWEFNRDAQTKTTARMKEVLGRALSESELQEVKRHFNHIKILTYWKPAEHKIQSLALLFTWKYSELFRGRIYHNCSKVYYGDDAHDLEDSQKDSVRISVQRTASETSPTNEESLQTLIPKIVAKFLKTCKKDLDPARLEEIERTWTSYTFAMFNQNPEKLA